MAEKTSRKISEFIGHLIQEKKGENVVLMEVYELLPVCDYFLIASGRNNRHLQTLARTISEEVEDQFDRKEEGMEGGENGGWVLIDYESVVVHLFLPDIRDYYRLERLWADAPRIELED